MGEILTAFYAVHIPSFPPQVCLCENIQNFAFLE